MCPCTPCDHQAVTPPHPPKKELADVVLNFPALCTLWKGVKSTLWKFKCKWKRWLSDKACFLLPVGGKMSTTCRYFQVKTLNKHCKSGADWIWYTQVTTSSRFVANDVSSWKSGAGEGWRKKSKSLQETNKQQASLTAFETDVVTFHSESVWFLTKVQLSQA